MNWWRDFWMNVAVGWAGAKKQNSPVKVRAPILVEGVVGTPAWPKAAGHSPTKRAALPLEDACPAPWLEQQPKVCFLPWLVPCGLGPLRMGDKTPTEQAALVELSALLALKNLPDAFLPRMADLLPQLIALTRDNHLPVKAVAQRVSKDPVLTAEVMRLVGSSYYNLQNPVTDILQAIQLIGSAGLRTAIARIVLKPIYREADGLVNAGMVTRLAAHSEVLAVECANLAAESGQSQFDGYLVGMLHDTGWRVALYAMERAKLPMEPEVSEKFAMEMTELTHRLFGLAARRWPITPGFTAFAQDAFSHGLAHGQHPLANVLRSALPKCLPDPPKA